jgi:hypothetical protein
MHKIKEILTAIECNEHYIDRYIKFLSTCEKRPTDKGAYLEEHHICPKQFFPEYDDLDAYPWNFVMLTAREHILAHVILWKAYGNKAIAPLYYMLNVQNSSTGYNYRDVPKSIDIRYAAKSREEFSKSRKGKAPYFTKEGVSVGLLNTNDPRIETEGLVGALAGYKMSEESRENMRRAKDPYRTTMMFNSDTMEQRSVLDADVESMKALGWKEKRDDKWSMTAREYTTQKAIEANTGTTAYYYPNSGILYGRIPHDSPIIKELGLVHIRSEKQNKQASEQAAKNAADPVVQAKKSKAISKLKWFHNPTTKENGRFLVCPEGWVPNRGDTVTNNGKTAYNDGVRNYMISPGDFIDPSWNLGMAPQKVRMTNFTNGVDWLLLKSGDVIPPGYKRAKKP